MQLDQEIRSPKNSHGDESAADGQVDKAMGNKNGHGNDSNGDEQLDKTVTTRMAMVVKAMAMRTIKSVPQISIKMTGNGEECTKGGGRSENI